MFPGAGAVVYRNEAGEPLGWDNPSYDEPPDPDDWYDAWDRIGREYGDEIAAEYDDDPRWGDCAWCEVDTDDLQHPDYKLCGDCAEGHVQLLSYSWDVGSMRQAEDEAYAQMVRNNFTGIMRIDDSAWPSCALVHIICAKPYEG